MWVKICANTNLQDAALAAELGADAVGFVFAPSPRRVTVEQVAAITGHLPDTVERIGVFHGFDVDQIDAAVRTAHLTGVQLHGGLSKHFLQALVDRLHESIRIIQTTHWRVGEQTSQGFASELAACREEPEIDAVLVDSRTTVADGGTGVTFDWDAARASLSALGDKPLIVAGGLNAANVAEAIAKLQPWGVDVASGVEASPGAKDPARLRAFINAARAAR
jgi:phosphoribosylanthranilate isomerase